MYSKFSAIEALPGLMNVGHADSRARFARLRREGRVYARALMKRIGLLGGMSAQATTDFEGRVLRWAQRLVPQHWNDGLPRMAVWYHQGPPFRLGDDGQPVLPRELDPDVVVGARWLGRVCDFLVMPCNTAHLS